MQTWLQLFRIHTAALTIPLTCLGYVLANGEIFSPKFFLFAFFGFLFHAIGFLDNNIQDYPYDLRDPAKKHFPLVKGAIPLKTAKRIFIVGLISLICLGLILSQGKIVAIILLFFCIINGLIYNRICKKSLLAPIPITLCFSPLVLFSYFSETSDLNLLIMLVFFFICLQMWHQIAFSGYWKDWNDPINLLRVLGMKVTQVGDEVRLIPSRAVKRMAWGVKIPNIFIGIFIWSLNADPYTLKTPSDFLSFAFVASMSFLVTIYVGRQTWDTIYNQKEITSLCAKVEITTYFLLVFALASILGIAGTVFFIFFPLAWYVAMNRLMWYGEDWKSLIAPRV